MKYAATDARFAPNCYALLATRTRRRYGRALRKNDPWMG